MAQDDPTNPGKARSGNASPALPLLLAGAYGVTVFAYWWRPARGDGSALYDFASWLAFMVRTFTPHFGLVLLAVLALCLWRTRWRLVGAALPLLVFANLQTLRDYLPKSAPASTGAPLRLMNLNLLYGNHRSAAQVLAQVGERAPDILTLQEYTTPWHKALSPALLPDLPHAAWQTRDQDAFGAAVYTKFPIVGEPRLDLQLADHDACQMRIVLALPNRNVALYNIHVMPPAGRKKMRLQEKQLAGLLDILKDETLPVLLCGDFNFTVESHYHGELARLGFRNAHQLAGRGRASTWPALHSMRWLPGVRIDHIYLSEAFACAAHDTGRRFGSDHLPIFADIALPAERVTTSAPAPRP